MTLRQKINHFFPFRLVNRSRLGQAFQLSPLARAIEATIVRGTVEYGVAGKYGQYDYLKTEDNNPLNHYRRIKLLDDHKIDCSPTSWKDNETKKEFIIYNHPRVSRPDLSGQDGVLHPGYYRWHIFYASGGAQPLPINPENFGDFAPQRGDFQW